MSNEGKTLMQVILDKKRRKFIEVSFDKMTELINTDPEIDRTEFINKHNPNLDRSIVINIQGIEDMDTGFKWVNVGTEQNPNYQVARFRRATDQPTLSVDCDENTFIYITLQKVTLIDAYMKSATPTSKTHKNYDGNFRRWSDGTPRFFIVYGEAPLRDVKLFDMMFKQYAHVFQKVWKRKHTNEKIVAVPDL